MSNPRPESVGLIFTRRNGSWLLTTRPQMAVSGHNQLPTRCPGGQPPLVAGHPRPLALLVLGASVCLLGCATGGHPGRASSPLVAGGRAGPIPAARLAPAANLAKRFADAYARSIYRPRPPRLPGATVAVERHLLVATAHVPPARRSHHPRASAVRLEPRSPSVLGASVVIEDRSATSFSVSFTVALRGGRWRVVEISPPS
jgi:hypothetical protein